MATPASVRVARVCLGCWAFAGAAAAVPCAAASNVAWAVKALMLQEGCVALCGAAAGAGVPGHRVGAVAAAVAGHAYVTAVALVFAVEGLRNVSMLATVCALPPLVASPLAQLLSLSQGSAPPAAAAAPPAWALLAAACLSTAVVVAAAFVTGYGAAADDPSWALPVYVHAVRAAALCLLPAVWGVAAGGGGAVAAGTPPGVAYLRTASPTALVEVRQRPSVCDRATPLDAKLHGSAVNAPLSPPVPGWVGPDAVLDVEIPPLPPPVATDDPNAQLRVESVPSSTLSGAEVGPRRGVLRKGSGGPHGGGAADRRASVKWREGSPQSSAHEPPPPPEGAAGERPHYYFGDPSSGEDAATALAGPAARRGSLTATRQQDLQRRSHPDMCGSPRGKFGEIAARCSVHGTAASPGSVTSNGEGSGSNRALPLKPTASTVVPMPADCPPCPTCSSPSTPYCPTTGRPHAAGFQVQVDPAVSAPASQPRDSPISPGVTLISPESAGGQSTLSPSSPGLEMGENALLSAGNMSRKGSRSRVRRESTFSIHHKSSTKAIEKTVKWKRGALLGQGGFGQVHLGLNLDTGELMAVKNIDLALSARAGQDVNRLLEQLRQEIQIMQTLDHAHVIKYFFTERVGTAVNIFMEYIPGGSLQALLNTFGPLSEEAVVQYTFQLLGGLKHLHDLGIIHRDIKGANILLTVEGTVKLADFGAAAKCLDLKLSAATDRSLIEQGVQGTPFWMAPEVLRGEEHDWEADIWSLGCTVMEMLTAEHPWKHLDLPNLKVLHWICEDEVMTLPAVLTGASKGFLHDCLQRDAARRPAAAALIEHHYFYYENADDDLAAPASPASVARMLTSRPRPAPPTHSPEDRPSPLPPTEMQRESTVGDSDDGTASPVGSPTRSRRSRSQGSLVSGPVSGAGSPRTGVGSPRASIASMFRRPPLMSSQSQMSIGEYLQRRASEVQATYGGKVHAAPAPRGDTDTTTATDDSEGTVRSLVYVPCPDLDEPAASSSPRRASVAESIPTPLQDLLDTDDAPAAPARAGRGAGLRGPHMNSMVRAAAPRVRASSGVRTNSNAVAYQVHPQAGQG